MKISFCSVKSPVVNISKSSTNKAFQTPKDSPDLESSLDYFHKLFTPPFIILKPDSILHAWIVLHLLLIMFISIDHSPRFANDGLQVSHTLSNDNVPDPQVDCVVKMNFV
nr:hypothetical protein [Tanacetum cinerariifolium]